MTKNVKILIFTETSHLKLVLKRSLVDILVQQWSVRKLSPLLWKEGRTFPFSLSLSKSPDMSSKIRLSPRRYRNQLE